MSSLDRIIVNGVERAVEAGAPMTEPWSSERARREKAEENRQQLPPVDPPWPIPEEERELPDSSTASVDDVLSLDSDKKPKWAAPTGGGGDTFVVTFTGNSSSITSDKTAAEIVAAAQAKKVIVGYWGNSPYQLELVDAYEYGGELDIVGIQFLSIWFGGDGPEGTPVNYDRIMFDGSSWAYEEKTQYIFD